jgi:hypothetical protein
VKYAKNKTLQAPGTQRQGTYPGEDWQLDFTHKPGGPSSKLLLVQDGKRPSLAKLKTLEK